MKRVIFNQKGGVGKTSIAVNLAAAFAAKGQKTLLIDLDAQANASSYALGDRLTPDAKTISDFFEASLGFKLFKEELGAVVQHSAYEGLYVIPASKKLSELQPKLEARYKIFKLAEALETLVRNQRFDQVIIDTAPALNFYSMSALLAVDSVLIPFDCDAFSAKAVLQVMDTVEEVIVDHKPELKVEGIIINHFQRSAKLPQESVDLLIASGFPVLKPYLSGSVLMKESHSVNRPLPFFSPAHKLSQELLELSAGLLATEVKGTKGKTKPHRAAQAESSSKL